MLFVYFMLDAPGMAKRRAEVRPEHQRYLAGEGGRFFAAGPLWRDDLSAMTGSIFVMEWPNRDAAAAWLRDEPFARSGVYGSVHIKAYDNKWPKRGRPTVRDRLFAYFNLNGADAALPRKAHRPAHLDYLAATEDHIFAAGPLFDDSRAASLEDRIGSLYIVDFAGRADADAWFAAEPFNASGVYGSRWTQAYENLWPKNNA